MTKLLIATRNQGKIAEIREALAGLPAEVVGLDEAGAPKADLVMTRFFSTKNCRKPMPR